MGSVVDMYEVMWVGGGVIGTTVITGDSTSYIIIRLEGESSYTITVKATNAAGSAVSDPIIETTLRAGKQFCTSVCVTIHFKGDCV